MMSINHYTFHPFIRNTLRKSTFIILLIIAVCFSTLNAQSYEILFDTHNASGWFGGDNRTNIGPRHVGVAQSVLIDSAIILNSFAFDFTSRFDYSENPDGFGHEVTLTLNIRDDSGITLQTEQVVVPASYNGGWITWAGINMNVDANTTLIFSAYLVGAYDTAQYTTGHKCDSNAGFLEGERYVKVGTSDADMEFWVDWNLHPWDSNFWLQGTLVVVPVELTSFTATANGNDVTLSWQTATEENNLGFEVLRLNQQDMNWKQIDFVEGNGTTTEINNYSYTYKHLPLGKYSYKLVQIDFDGTRNESETVSVEVGNQPTVYYLTQNFPNPFNPSTTIQYTIPESGKVRLSVFNELGEEVKTLVNETKEPGVYKVEFNANEFPSGIYFYKIQSGSFVDTKKMILLK